MSKDGSFLACLYESDVSFLDVEEGVATKRLRKEDAAGAEEEIVRARGVPRLLLPLVFCFVLFLFCFVTHLGGG